MYCRFCGKEIADNSNFCSECGKSLNTIETIEIPKEEITQTQELHKKGRIPTALKAFFILFIITAIVALTVGLVLGQSDRYSTKSSSSSSNKNSSSITNNDDNKILSRNANLNVVNIVWQNNAIAYQGTLIPKNDIENLIITFNFYNENKTKVIKTIEKRFGNVTKSQQYEFTISISEIGLSNVSKTGGAKYTVTSGQIKYID